MVEADIFKFERWTEEYIPDLVKQADNPNVTRNLRDVFPNPYTEEDARFWIDICAKADERTDINRAITIDDRAVGGIGLTLGSDVYRRSAELGYWLGEEFWGRGIMTAAVKSFCCFGFENFDIVRIFAGAFARNAASRRVLEKAGFVLEGINRDSVCKNGELLDSCMYALLKS